MRSFFKSELETLKIKTGLNQYETLSAMKDNEGNPIGAQTISKLLDALCLVCDGFGYIPDPDKKRIIQAAIINDQDFTGLNSRVVWKWLNAQSAKYFKEAAHIKEPDPIPVAYNKLSPETKAEVDDFIRKLQSQGNGLKTVPVVSQAEIDSIRMEDLEEREGKRAESVGVHYTTQEEAELRDKKIEWARLYTDLYTGKLKEGAPSFSDWLKEK